MTKEFEYDIVIIGGGPNGLLAGSYLSKAGLKVIVLDRRHEMGGGEFSRISRWRHPQRRSAKD